MYFKSIIISSLLTAGSAGAAGFDDYKRATSKAFSAEKESFSAYKIDAEAAFAQYQKELDDAYSTYKKELGAYWDEPKLSTQRQWVAYTPDKKTRSTVDFENGEIVIETIASNPQAARANLENSLRRTVTIDTKQAYENDPLQQRIVKIKPPQNTLLQSPRSEPVLSNVIFDAKPSRENVNRYLAAEVSKKNITLLPSAKVPGAQRYTLRVKLPSDAMLKRSQNYQRQVADNAARFKIPAPLIFAVIHTESSYNPFARSHIPAYGLMQIVPKSAGLDTYLFLHKKKRLLSSQYLYNSSNNIEIGSGYLHMLYYKYLKDIENPNSRLYCTIAAYNTGAGNIAYAFNGTYNVSSALKKINAMKAEEVYGHLLKNLRYDEPKAYLQRVVNRMAAYHKVYGDSGNRKQ